MVKCRQTGVLKDHTNQTQFLQFLYFVFLFPDISSLHFLLSIYTNCKRNYYEQITGKINIIIHYKCPFLLRIVCGATSKT